MELAENPKIVKRQVDQVLIFSLLVLTGLMAWSKPVPNQLIPWAVVLCIPLPYWLVLRVPLNSLATTVHAEGTSLTVVLRGSTFLVKSHEISAARYNPGIRGHPDRIFITFKTLGRQHQIVFVPVRGFWSSWKTQPLGIQLLKLSRLGG